MLRKIAKRYAELNYWRRNKAREGELTNEHYERFFTVHFGLDRDFYEGKRVLDIGCGPRGSLEWADMAGERVGCDPLARSYLSMGAGEHRMSYVAARCENMPFDDEHFDVVSSFNSLDHVDDLDRSIAEITRVTRRGGTLLLISEVDHPPTWTEPQSFSWDILNRFKGWETVSDKRCAKRDGLYASLRAAAPYVSGPGIISARLIRNE